MEKLLKLIIQIVIIIIVYSIVQSLTSSSKNSLFVKSNMFIIIILITMSFFNEINFKSKLNFNVDDYKINKDQVWQNSIENIEKQLESQILKLCLDNGLVISSCTINLIKSDTDIIIDEIKINGPDKTAAKNLITGYFKLNPAYIITNGE